MQRCTGRGSTDSFGELLRRYRLALHLTQQALAARAGMTVQAVSLLERGARRRPRRETVGRLSRALRLGPAEADAFVAASAGDRRLAVTAAESTGAGRTLPRDVASFTGRTAELADIVDAVAEGAIAAIDGMPGAGKTAFAIHAAHLLAPRFPDGQIFLGLHAHTAGQRPVTPEDALASLLVISGVRPRLVPAGLDARAAMWRDRLAGRRVLLLLDDAAGHEQVRPLLPGTPGCHVIVTSRRRLTTLEDVRPLTLGTMRPADASALFARLAGIRAAEAGDRTVGELVDRCGFLPLAIHLVAGRLRSHPTWTVRHMADLLQSAQDRLRELHAGNVAVESAFELSYRNLPVDRQRLFRRLGLHPGRDFDAAGAAALDAADQRETARGLEALHDDHLVEETAPGRYRLHDLLRQYARSLAGRDDRRERDAAVHRLLDHYLDGIGGCLVRSGDTVGGIAPLRRALALYRPAGDGGGAVRAG